MLTVDVIPGRSLTQEHMTAWSRLQQQDESLSSPYFRPEFTEAVASVRDDVEVAVLKQDGKLSGFFPFHRGTLDLGRPVGGKLSDFHGVIAGRDVAWDARTILQRARLLGWEFDHLVAEQQPFQEYHNSVKSSPYIDLSRGFDAWRSERRVAGSSEIEQTLRKQRKCEREVGSLRFEAHTDDRKVLETLLAWKADQYQRTNHSNVFGVEWTVKLLDEILARQSDEFAGTLSALYAGDRLIAAHFGMRSAGVLHFWFPAYDTEFGKYSPGLILLVEIARACEELKLRRIDLGKGNERYKLSFASGSTPVAEGTVYSRAVPRLLRSGWRRTKDWIRTTPIREPARASLRWLREMCGRHEFL